MDADSTVTMVLPQTSRVVDPEMSVQNKPNQQLSRLCPLCQSEIRLFFINFNDKLLMCANDQCEFPFGHEELQFVKEDSEILSQDESSSLKTNICQRTNETCSIASATMWSEIQKMNNLFDEFNECDTPVASHTAKQEKEKKMEKQKKNEIEKNIAELEVLNEKLAIETKDNSHIKIKNERWLKKLGTLQQLSGVKLLKNEEFKSLKKDPAVALGEYKIDFEPGLQNNMSAIKIEIHNAKDALNRTQSETA